MSSLYELTGSRLVLQQKLEVLNFDDETITDTLEGESSELAAKVEDYGYVLKNMTAFEDAIQLEIDRLQARKLAAERKREKTMAWLLDNMLRCDYLKVECPAFTIAVQTNRASVDVLDEKQIPDKYMRQPEVKIPPMQPDKKMILVALESGLPVAGCAIKHTHKLVIK